MGHLTSCPRRLRHFLVAAVLVLACAVGEAAGVPVAAYAGPQTPATSWYLALGDSIAAGYQPGLGDDPSGGYAGRVLTALNSPSGKTQLRNLGCGRETSTTFVQGGQCAYEQGSQLAQAVVFLRSHSTTTRLVTLTVGGQDVIPCLSAADPQGCVSTQLTTLATNLGRALSQLHAAAPTARIVVTNYYDPYLAAWFTSPDLASLSLNLLSALNSSIGAVTTASGDDIADVASAFQTNNATLVNGIPLNVLTVCQLTWMCSQNDDHPNDAGYTVIASAVRAKL